ncbi:hypothetical protein LJB90_03775 [Eubacteriales bacterium OttesenSCG-928-G02]|nr:hypothetical protein [Eubacteriales bacterium OttesenSCG-928-G02]
MKNKFKLLLFCIIAFAFVLLFVSCAEIPISTSSDTPSDNLSSAISMEQSMQEELSSQSESIISTDEPSSNDEVSAEASSAESSNIASAEPSSEPPDESKDNSESSVSPNGVREVNGIIINGHMAVEQYGGGVNSGALYAKAVNSLKKSLGSGVNVYSMPIPLAGAFYSPPGYSFNYTNHLKTFNSIRENLDEVIDINLLEYLDNHKEEKLYLYTEHHWAALGAYYAAEAIAKTANLPFADISTMETKSFDNFLGSFAKLTKDAEFAKHPETFTYYVPKTKYTANFYSVDKFTNPKENDLFFNTKSYLMFLGGDAYSTHIKTSAANGRTAVLFKDSFGNPIAPYMLESFEDIYVLDIRYFKLNGLDFIKEKQATDVIIALSAYTVVSSTVRNTINGWIK